MQAYFQFHSKLDSFQLFSVAHLFTIGIILALCLLLFVIHNEVSKKQRILRFLLVFILFIADLLHHLWLIYENAWSIKKDLPLHLSDLAVFLAIVMLLTRNYKLFQFMYFAGIGSSIQAIITPDLGKFSFPHFQYFEFFILHGGVVLACLLIVVAFKFKPTHRSLWATILIVNLYAACVFFINKTIGSNYLYIIEKPGNASILNYLGPWPWYLLSMELVMILSFYILYSPYRGVSRRRR
ncbi:TIGR02206 family membrane protein [Neobacillus sp. PS3-40]|uniref:YwaF family protein n=1 Tax=Neobacillus sp. PS3-40 TaxID=3070679 RepID=UPI0027DFF389|nr:TIGR02206 family membrane protein [Neobacillus sp. PS3-40]WML43904.1 TIGR02206 family membrane protein [Neobacillus sp. PS3-40]